ncbi:MAG TPA: heparan-alpha-glucosaminide N-acetyltransferase domain-containing protein [Pyrinomonadaceae bacterium]|nr:heparan-alpha-glucosaminide N-acetyltransferase domain-containing protein [Pyrinomonadaceae bacterium]
MENTLARSATERLVSLDAFRGLTIAGMVLVNNPGSWSHIYWPLGHASWHGWTPTDLIFPFFLFIVGVSITLALGPRSEESADTRSLYWKIIKRALIIFGLGLFLAGFPYFPLSTIRIMGVLQRIGICYLLAAVIFLKTDLRKQLIITTALLIGYWLIMTFIPTPGFKLGDYSREGSIACFIDRKVLRNHIWSQGKIYDPEGLLSTLPAIATTLLGVLTGQLLRSKRKQYEKIALMFVAGFGLIIGGWIWNLFFPINKSLWTSSYVLFTGGLAMQFLALCYWLIDMQGYRRWTKPFVVFGVNAIALFVGTGLMARLLGIIKVSGPEGTKIALKTWLYDNLFLSWAPPYPASLSFAIAFVLLWLGLMWLLYRRRIFIKI